MIAHISKATHASIPTTVDALRHMAASLTRLPPNTTWADPTILSLIQSKADIKSLERLLEEIADVVAELDHLRATFASPETVLSNAEELSRASSSLIRASKHLRVDDRSLREISASLQSRHQELLGFSSLIELLQRFWTASELPGELNSTQIAQLLKCIALFRDTPEKVIRARAAQLFTKDAKAEIETARAQSDEVRRALHAVGSELRLELLPSPDRLLAMAGALRSSNAITALFSKDCAYDGYHSYRC